MSLGVVLVMFWAILALVYASLFPLGFCRRGVDRRSSWCERGARLPSDLK